MLELLIIGTIVDLRRYHTDRCVLTLHRNGTLTHRRRLVGIIHSFLCLLAKGCFSTPADTFFPKIVAEDLVNSTV